ncbi:DUF4215 domain-containing protein [Chondromyces apiculatus]|uniref:Multiple EGF-like-domain protein 3 n=1 Tax=Chondromyces apiculatus DSM 436 TaxID=1192034 RepID=A0A017T5I9_9BACT|nr:DUF4215 domain-containing protein [Chondromyces apiculatus]EYF04499.1 Hypothetical protein CAP_4467 [Chondromyces apiculatus DSM 436]
MKRPAGLLLALALAAGTSLGCAPELRLGDVCADGAVTAGEACDDGNSVPGDGCDAACAVEQGYACSGSPSTCAPICNDGFLVAGVECEGGDLGGQTCEGLQFQRGDLACNADCTFDTSACIPNEDCNNGVDDDGNGTADCADAACAGVAPCDGSGEVVCDDAQDNDHDGFLDCDDASDCQGLGMCIPGETPLGGSCQTSHECQASANDPFCIAEARFEGWTDGYCSEFCDITNDDCPAGGSCFDTGLGNGHGVCLQSCTDSAECRPGYTCNAFGVRSMCWPGLEICDNGLDDDNNGVSDCDDDKCRSFAACAQCGDGFVSSNEQCDDGGTTGGDGCAADCRLEGSSEVEPNNNCLEPGGPLGVPSVVHGTSSVSENDYYAINVPARADLRIRVHNVEPCSSYLSWSGSNCNTTQFSSCDQLDSIQYPRLKAVPQGIYYVRVRGNTSTMTDIPYTLEVSYDALCGNGVVEGSEQCDGGSNCTAFCQFPTTCGDGLIEGNEQCDDGNTQNGDGCSSTCLLLPNAEQEPNDICGQSNGLFFPDALVSGAINPAGESDYFAFLLNERADLRIETFGAGGPGTCGADTVIVLSRGSGCGEYLTENDQAYENGTYSDCSLIEASNYPVVRDLEPGNYFVRVFGYFPEQSFNYTLLVSKNVCGDGRKGGIEECDGGPDCTSDCNLITVCGDEVREGNEQCDPSDVVTCGLTCNTVRPPETDCQDLFDNSGNGLTDCEDPDDCRKLPVCTPGAGAIGGPCTAPSDCQATNEDPICFPYGNGYCSEFCNLQMNDCPTGAVCINYWGFESGAGSCMKACTTVAECGPGQFCAGNFCAP